MVKMKMPSMPELGGIIFLVGLASLTISQGAFDLTLFVVIVLALFIITAIFPDMIERTIKVETEDIEIEDIEKYETKIHS